MRRDQPTRTERTWRAPWTASPSRTRRRTPPPGPRGLPLGGARGRQAGNAGRFGGVFPGGRPARRGKPPSQNGVTALGHRLLAAVRSNKPAKAPHKAPALAAALVGLGGAAAVALKRRGSGKAQPTPVAPAEGVGEDTSTAAATPPSGSP